jgi:hypothetical protein
VAERSSSGARSPGQAPRLPAAAAVDQDDLARFPVGEPDDPRSSRLSDSHNAHIFRAQAIGRNAQKLAWILGFLIGHAAPIALNSMHRSTHCFDSAF